MSSSISELNLVETCLASWHILASDCAGKSMPWVKSTLGNFESIIFSSAINKIVKFMVPLILLEWKGQNN